MRRTSRWGRGWRTLFPALLGITIGMSADPASAQGGGPTGPPPAAAPEGRTHDCRLRGALVQDGKNWGLRVEGDTNLPDGTELLISLSYCDAIVDNTWSRVYVKGPSFTRDLGPFQARPFAGTYTVRAFCDLERQDPIPYVALQDEGNLEFETPVYLGEKELELTEDKAFLDWITRSRSNLADMVKELRDMFRSALEKREFRSDSGAFDAHACMTWTDRWIARARSLGAGAEAFRANAFAPKFPKWIQTLSETISTIVEYGCCRATQCFQANGVPAPPKYSAGGGAFVEEKDATTVPVLSDLDPIIAALTEKTSRLEKELHDPKSK
ncbi:MAG: hypothetical protein HYY93_00855 [Planctomycetes bacterium]|nr:hypothetical protein [Planctomycetota bacterium]